jgi:ABC-type uncharacterized transport system ATPase subunit
MVTEVAYSSLLLFKPSRSSTPLSVILYLASLKNADMARARRRLDEWLERFDLAEWKNRTPEALSKGMAQKAQFVAAVLHDPELVFLDEPFSGVDPIAVEGLQKEIARLREEHGIAILLTDHNVRETLSVTDRCNLSCVYCRPRTTMRPWLTPTSSGTRRSAALWQWLRRNQRS